jgi:hypothetical protein
MDNALALAGFLAVGVLVYVIVFAVVLALLATQD